MKIYPHIRAGEKSSYYYVFKKVKGVSQKQVFQYIFVYINKQYEAITYKSLLFFGTYHNL